MKQISLILIFALFGCRHSSEPDSPSFKVPSIKGEVLSMTGLPLNNVAVGLKLLIIPDSVLFPGGTLTSDSSLLATAVIGLDTTDEDGLFSIPYSDSSLAVNLFAYRKGFEPWHSATHQDSLPDYEIRLQDLRFNTVDTSARFRFTAVVDIPDGRNPFSLSLGDMIIGEFWYSPVPAQGYGWYPQDSLSGGLTLPIAAYTFNASTSPPTQFGIRVYDNSHDYGTSPRDILEFLVRDPELADALSVDDVNMSFTFHDHSASLLDDGSLPTELNLRWFETANVFFNGSTGSVAQLNWHLRLVITSLERTQ